MSNAGSPRSDVARAYASRHFIDNLILFFVTFDKYYAHRSRNIGKRARSPASTRSPPLDTMILT